MIVFGVKGKIRQPHPSSLARLLLLQQRNKRKILRNILNSLLVECLDPPHDGHSYSLMSGWRNGDGNNEIREVAAMIRCGWWLLWLDVGGGGNGGMWMVTAMVGCG